ncbi:MAG: 6,7-dimethyl-8-ribityllumazine synthase [Alphaproteobacteria bacterium]|nr:6,7-dimethyl-8-ribityllumazine synthase [Alphaproteobacteria bacterium]MCL2505991.1 6,7-dimethyl-8-ribityllumazine synthase [Alphaproteobacteria bacterium]
METQKPVKDAENFKFDMRPHVLIVCADFYPEITEKLAEGATQVLVKAKVTYEKITVPGALEIPAAIAFSMRSLDFDPLRRRNDGYIALGCVIKGETMHDEIVGRESARALQDLAVRRTIAIGNGILTCNTMEQAQERADVNKQNRGGAAAMACLQMLELKQKLRLMTKRRWVVGPQDR